MPTFHYNFDKQSDLIAAIERFHDAGVDPAFDNELEELERQFAELRLSPSREPN
jgi:hypothetical protein